ncbi:hypothetical protein Tco_1397673, partial [Tanacetum coccineum]
MVAYLQKPEGSEAFHQVVDFLNASHIKHLKLEDSDGITSLPNTEIFEQLALIGVDFPLFPTMITAPESLADEATFISVGVTAGGTATTDIGLDVGQGSGTIHKTPTRPHDSPLLRVHTLGNDEGSLQQNELIDLVTKLTDRVEVLENHMQQTKKVYSSALTKLVLRVKKLEKTVKTNKARRRDRIVISKDEDAEEDSSKQGWNISKIDKDSTISLVQPEQDMEYDFDVIYIRRSVEKRKDKGKAIMKEDESVQKESRKKLEQERLVNEEAIRLQEQINEEENQRIARDAEIDKQLQEEFDRARQEQEVVAEVDQAHDIDWSDPAVLRYHALQNRSFSKAEVRKNMSNIFRLFNEKYASTRPGEVSIHMLVENKYPLPQDTLMRMLQWKLHVNYNVTEIAYELL